MEISKHHMLILIIFLSFSIFIKCIHFKTPYVDINLTSSGSAIPFILISKHHMLILISPYRYMYLLQNHISKHHMLILIKSSNTASNTVSGNFKTPYVDINLLIFLLVFNKFSISKHHMLILIVSTSNSSIIRAFISKHHMLILICITGIKWLSFKV